jgi:hypothetical protein
MTGYMVLAEMIYELHIVNTYILYLVYNST